MKTQITTILIVCGALLASATSASALSGQSGGWHCWFTVSEQTCYWPHEGEPYYNLDGTRNVKADTVINETEVAEIDTGTVIGETEVAMLRPRSEIKYWACMNGATGYTMQNKNSPCKYTPRPVYGRIGSISPGQHTGTDDTTVAMMTQDMIDAFDGNYNRHYSSSAVDLDENYSTQLAFRGRGSTCSLNPYGRRSSYCNDSEVAAPVEQITASTTEFGNCLLEDKPIDIESLVDCRSDACLGRKFYYGL